MSEPSVDPREFVQLVSARWILLVLAELAVTGRRYQDLCEVLDGVSYKVLTETLRRAERDGLVVATLMLNGSKPRPSTS